MAFFFCCAATNLIAQVDIADPAKSGFDIEILAEIDRLMSEGIAAGKMVGCNAMILKDDQVCYYREWGQQNRKSKSPVTRDTIWRIYSMSKPITSIAAMQLVEKDQLDLDAPVSKYLPEFADLKVLVENDGEFEEVEPLREMIVRDLFRHSSGLTYGFFGTSEVDKRYLRSGILRTEPDLKAMVEKLGRLPLKHHPGERFEYSVSTDVLGYLVQVVSQKRFDEYLSENIFQPLSMNGTAFMVASENKNQFSDIFRPTRDGVLELSPSRSSARFLDPENRFFSGGGGLCCTIDDYKQFCRMLLNDGQLDGKQIVSSDSLKEMWTNQLGDLKRTSGSFRFGLGFSISREGDYSWGGAAGTRFWVNPEKNLAMIFMVQVNPYRQSYGKQMRKIVYRALENNRSSR